jgi:ADP-ribose pyrophosphatase YjhB (NUDIX family)
MWVSFMVGLALLPAATLRRQVMVVALSREPEFTARTERKEQVMRVVARRAVRAILLDDDAQIVLLRRTRPDREVYWTAPGGTVESDDATLEDALRRELAEELGAHADRFSRVFLFSSLRESQLTVQYVYVCRLVSMDVSARHGPEFDDASRGRFDPDPLPLFGSDLTCLALKPPVLLDFIVSNRDALLAEISPSHGQPGGASG